MKITYARQAIDQSMFLAGPTPRKHTKTPSWRPEALSILERLEFKGTVYVPEDSTGSPMFDYDDQIGWEWDGLNAASVIPFWVPRELVNMPAFTTNVEFGRFVSSGKCILGYPPEAVGMKYLHKMAERYNVKVCHTLEETLQSSIEYITKFKEAN